LNLQLFHEGVYLDELDHQLFAANKAMGAFERALSANDVVGVFDHAADILNHAGIISKLLKPGGPKEGPARMRGRHLRGVLGVADDDPVLNRDLRDLLEHIDARLDEWVARVTEGEPILIDRYIGNASQFRLPGVDASRYAIRMFDPETDTFIVLGRSFDLRELVGALDRLGTAVQARLRHTKA
jgi:hypothetical protein